jgi:ribosomal protein L11 methyltransferase
VANGVADRVTVLEGDATVLLPLVGPVRVVLANILSSVITAMLPVISDGVRAGGVAIFSGILLAEREAMLATFGASGAWRVVRETSEGEWWAVLVERVAG